MEKLIVQILGFSESWHNELIDVAVLSGFEASVICLSRFNPSDLVDLDPMNATDAFQASRSLFLGFQPHPRFASEAHPMKVNLSRRLILEDVIAGKQVTWARLLHPSAWISPSAEIGKGVFVGANSSIGSKSSLADHVTVNRNVSVGHDVRIGTGAEIAPQAHISSGSQVGSWSYVGPGAMILNDIEIGDYSVVGAGSVVTRDVSSGSTVFGAPAKPSST